MPITHKQEGQTQQVNLIAEDRITGPKQVKAMYESMIPESKRDAIEKRDDDNNI